VNFDFNQLPKNRRLMILDFLENPSRKRALKRLKDTPLILLVADEYFSQSKLKENLREIVATDINEKYITEFLEYDICSHLNCELSSLKFITKYGSDSNRRLAKRIYLEKKLVNDFSN